MTNIQQKGHQFEYRMVKLSEILVDPLYQRELNQSKVEKILKHWNYDLVNAPKLSMRADGRFYVINGQHTVAALKIHEGKDTPILCKVYRGLTWEEEKDLFIQQNGITSDPTTFEKLRAEFNGGNVEIRDMVKAAAEAGVQVTFETKGEAFARCKAHSALLSMYKTLPRADYVNALQLITAAWKGQMESYQAGFIKGMTNIFRKYKGKFRYADMVKALEKNTPSYYIREAKDLNGQLGNRFEKLFIREYNKRRTARLGE